jgi:hypothetical protein
MSFTTLDAARGRKNTRRTFVPLLAVATRGDNFVLSTPYVRDGAGAPTFSCFGVQDLTTFNTAWTFTFPTSAAPTATAMFGGMLSVDLVSGSGFRVTIAPFDLPLMKFIKTELPNWVELPNTVVYEFLTESSVTTAITAIVAALPYGRVKAGLKEAAKINSAYAVTGTEATDRANLVNAVLDGTYDALVVTAGATLGSAAVVSSSPNLVVRCALNETIFVDPAFYLRQLYSVCRNLDTHEDAALFTEHRGVYAATGVIRTLADAPSGTLFELLTLVRDEESDLATIVLETTELIDFDHENQTGAPSGTPDADWDTFFEDNESESLVIIDFPVNIVGLDPTPMLNPPAFDAENAASGDYEGYTPLTYTLATDPGSGATTPPVTISVVDGVAPASWATFAATGDMPVIQGGRVQPEPDEGEPEPTLAAQLDAFRGMKVVITDPTVGAMSIANVAFSRGGVRSSSDPGLLAGDRDPRGGGGLLIDGCSRVYVRNCIFAENRSVTGGDAIGGDLIGEQNLFRASGGGMEVYGGSPLIDGCYFEGNRAFQGGGLAIFDGSFPVVRHCAFFGNFAAKGGAIAIFQLSVAGAYSDAVISELATDVAKAAGIYLNGGDLAEYAAAAARTAANTYLTDRADFPNRGPILLWRCLMDGNEAFDNGGNLYLTAWALVLMQACVLRYGKSGMATWRGVSIDEGARGGGGNVRVTFASDLVIAGGEIYGGETEATDRISEGGGGISTRNADVALMTELDEDAFPVVRDNDSLEFDGGGIYFAGKWDRSFHGIELYWVLQCAYVMLEEHPTEAIEALNDPSFLLLAVAMSTSSTIVTTTANALFENWYDAHKTQFRMGTAHLIIEGGEVRDSFTQVSGTDEAKGGAIKISRINAGEGSDPPVAPLYSFVDADQWMCDLSISLSAGLQLTGNSTDEATPTTTMLSLQDTVPATDITKTDADLTQTGGTLTDPFTYP